MNPKITIEIPPNLSTDEFRKTWDEWIDYRSPMGKVKRWDILFKRQIAWLAQFDASMASKILDQSMRQGWTGLFELAQKYGQQPLSTNPSYYDLNKRYEFLNVECQKAAERLRGIYDRMTTIKRNLCIRETPEERAELNTLESERASLDPQWRDLCKKKRVVKARLILMSDKF